MPFAEVVSIIVTSVFALSMVNRQVAIAPRFQTVINGIFIGVNEGAWLQNCRQDRLNRLLLHVGEPGSDDLTTPLNHAQDRWLVPLKRASARLSLQPSATPNTPLLDNGCRMALVPSHNGHFITRDFTTQLDGLFFATIPSRNWGVMSCTTSLSTSSSAAICWFDRFRPMKYRHTIHTLSG
jgi:hypothetical protein